jgi:uncharacterized protein YidB (DUF937 family)
MDLMKLGTDLLMSKLGGKTDSNSIASTLSGLLSGGEGGAGGLGGIISAMQEKGLGSIVESWLGDGDNAEISPDQVREVVGSDKIAQMAAQIGSDEDSLLDGLKDALPQIVDKSSSGGSLLDNIGGLGGALDMAKKFLG